VERERLQLKDSDVRYMFSGKPFTSRSEFEGHAVRAMYASSGTTDYYAETGEPVYEKTLDTLWTDLTAHKMYSTGGVGPRSQGEAFGEPYELPIRKRIRKAAPRPGVRDTRGQHLPQETAYAKFATELLCPSLPFAVERLDDREDYGAERFISSSLAWPEGHVLLFVAYTEREAAREPNQPTRAYLTVIARDPDHVNRLLNPKPN
jgi:Beta-L-arabinofuranosidase, GH127